MFVIGIKFWGKNQYVITNHFYFTPVRHRLCVPWIYMIQFFIYLAAELFTQEFLFDMKCTHMFSLHLSLSFLYTRAKIWMVSKGHLSKQLVCIRDGDDIIMQGFGWGSVALISLRESKSAFMCYSLLSSAVNGLIISHHKYLQEIKL